jgi:hypothetical protein
VNMDHNSNLLHNMSAPPKSVVRFAGLLRFTTQDEPGGSPQPGQASQGGSMFGMPLRFNLDSEWLGISPIEMLTRLNLKSDEQHSANPSLQLSLLINTRANELPLPEGCAVIPVQSWHTILWSDPLTVLAILAKSTETVWLRSKTPSLIRAVQRESVSLLIPPGFAAKLPEAGI